jgi:hypothetical protein
MKQSPYEPGDVWVAMLALDPGGGSFSPDRGQQPYSGVHYGMSTRIKDLYRFICKTIETSNVRSE